MTLLKSSRSTAILNREGQNAGRGAIAAVTDIEKVNKSPYSFSVTDPVHTFSLRVWILFYTVISASSHGELSLLIDVWSS